jgi:hypothetical protein
MARPIAAFLLIERLGSSFSPLRIVLPEAFPIKASGQPEFVQKR